MKTLHPDLLQKNLENRARSDMAANIISGLAVLIRQNGQIVYENYFGTSVPEGELPVTQNTIFRLASMTKPVTAAAVLLLISRGLLSLDDPITKYLPEYDNLHLCTLDDCGELVTTDAAAVPVTVKHLLTHTSGIGSADVSIKQHELMTAEDNRTLENAVAYFSRQGLAFEPFSAQAYSALAGFDILARIVELVSGKDYNDFLTREIFTPCQMTDTTFLPSNEQWNRMITMHNRIDGKSCIGETFDNCVFGNIPCTHYLGGAGLVSTVRDYSNFAEMLLYKGSFHGAQIIPPELIRLMAAPHVPESIMPGNERWGLGVRVITGNTYPTLPVSSFGWSGAYGTHFWVDPVNQLTAVYMKNSHYDGGSGAVTAFHFEEDVYHSL